MTIIYDPNCLIFIFAHLNAHHESDHTVQENAIYLNDGKGGSSSSLAGEAVLLILLCYRKGRV